MENKKEKTKKERKLTVAEQGIFKQGRELGYKEGKEAGYIRGNEAGFVEGKKEGYDDGEKAGHKKGVTAGREKGLADGKILGYDKGFKAGSDYTHPIALHEGRTIGKKELVASIEVKLAEVAGYEDPLKWREEATIPAWWIAVLIDNYEGGLVVHSSAKSESVEETAPGNSEEEF